MKFGKELEKLRMRAGKSPYRLAKYSGLNQAYILRLENGTRGNPSRDVVIMLGSALVESSDSVALWDIDELLMSAEYAPFAGEAKPSHGLPSRRLGEGRPHETTRNPPYPLGLLPEFE